MKSDAKRMNMGTFPGMSPFPLIREGTRALEEAGIERPIWTAEQLLAERLGCLPVDLYVQAPAVSPEESLRYRAAVAARAGGMPLQYLLESADFYGRRFAVGPGVFNPRPETEILVSVVLELFPVRGELVEPRTFALRQAQGERYRVADVGAGSGSIAVTLAVERPELEVIAVERSDVALHFARRNAAAHGCEVRFLQGNLLEGFAPASLDAIVANPPYLNPARAQDWPRELAWEPWIALDGGAEGMELIGTLIRQAAAVLKPGAPMILEIGMDQAERISALAEKNSFRVERVVKDLANLDRVAVLWKN